MYPLRRIFQSTKYLKNYIYTSSVKYEESKKSDKPTETPKKEVNESSEFLRFLDLKKPEEESLTSPDAKQEGAHLKSEKTAKKSKSSKKQRNVINTSTGLENFFDSFPAKKALSSAAESVAEELGENKEEVKYDLMQYLQTLNVTKEEAQAPTYKTRKKVNIGASMQSVFAHVKDLGIFKDLQFPEESQLKLNIWDKLEEEELAYLSKTRPRNHFEELINWTNEGRMWNFPIDNEQGLDEESKFSFTQHVFLEQYLEPWCPKKGPLRRFMDLVLIGLGKNSYLSVEEKIEHIYWFKDYFESKKKLLKELGAVGSQKEIAEPVSEEKS